MPHSLELSTEEAKRLIDEIAAMEVPVFVLTGGDLLKRPDVIELVRYATDCNVRISLTPGPAPLLTRDSIVRLKECGFARLAVSLDGPTAAIHDGSRRVPGSYQWTIDAVRWAREIGLPVQRVLAKLYETSQRALFDVKSTEAQRYRRYLLHRRTEQKRFGEYPSETHQRFPRFIELPVSTATDGIGSTPRGIDGGKGFVFISHLGEVYPSGFLPRQRSPSTPGRHLPQLSAVLPAGRQQEPGREMQNMRITRDLWWLARTLVRHHRRFVRRRTMSLSVR